MASYAIETALMEFKETNIRRKTQRSFRIFEDQLESLRWLAEHKHRGRVNVSDLLREFLDKGIDREIDIRNHRETLGT